MIGDVWMNLGFTSKFQRSVMAQSLSFPSDPAQAPSISASSGARSASASVTVVDGDAVHQQVSCVAVT